MRVIERIDRIQRSRAWMAFPYAVVKKFGEDRGGRLSALIAFYGFFSLFPLLLVAITALGFVLRDHPGLQERILGSALSAFPVIGDQIRESVGGLEGGAIALTVGLLGALWAGLRGVTAVQIALNDLWDVPEKDRPGLLERVGRGLAMLAVLALLGIVAAGIAAFGASEQPVAIRIVAFVASFALDTVAFLLAFKILTERDLSWREVLPGALLAGAGWMALQASGGALVRTQLRNASETYGFFAIVIGLLSWMLITAQMMLIAAEVNVVLRQKLWPRSLGREPVTQADRRVLRRHAYVEERAPSEDVGVRFEDRDERRAR